MKRITFVTLVCISLGTGHTRRVIAQTEIGDAAERASCHHEDNWVDVQTLDADEPSARQALAIHGDTLVTGGAGHVRVYQRSHEHSWTLIQTLAPEAGVPVAAFGRGLALDAHTLIIGAGLEQPPSATVFPFGYSDVYRRHGQQWTFEARLQPDITPLNCGSAPYSSSFGENIALDGNLAVVTANRMSLTPGGCGQGAAFVFQRFGTSWLQVQVLSPPQVPISNPPSGYPNFDTNFGDSMSLSGDTLVIGQPGRGLTPPLQGAIHVFVRAGSSFSLQQAFVAPGVAYNTADGLGTEVAVHGRTLVAVENGNLRTFVRHGATWSARSEVPATTPSVGSHALARSADDLFVSGSGAIQVFEVQSDGELALPTSLTVDGAQSSSALAADHGTLAVAGDHGVHVLERH